MKRILFYAVALLVSGQSLWAVNYYVSKNGSNGTGSSWATAWNECDQIAWTGIQPGDTVFIDGGTDSLVYNSSLASGKDGTPSARIYLKRSLASGHNGKVVISLNNGIKVDNKYVVVDGGEREKFIVHGNMEAGNPVSRIGSTGDYSEIRNVYFYGSDSTPGWMGVSLNIYAANCLVYGCGFYKSAGEDQLSVITSGNLTIDHCEFFGLQPSSDAYVHRDIISIFGPAPGSKHVIKNCYFHDNGTDDIIVIPMGDNDLGAFEIEYNVFSNVNTAIKFDSSRMKSITYAKILNNVFRSLSGPAVFQNSGVEDKTTIFDRIDFSNSIFSGNLAYIAGAYIVPKYSLWDNTAGTPGFTSGNGNLQGDPKFINPANFKGTDNILYTTDDGLNIQAGSAAIDHGIDVGLTQDILGKPIVGTPDMGAYEYTTTEIRRMKDEIRNPGFFSIPNPLSIDCLLRSCDAKNIRIYNLDGKEMSISEISGHQMYLIWSALDGKIQKIIIIK